MTDHAWFLEHIASHLAGGLDAAEAGRFEEHAAVCETCARALAEARALDRTLDDLFAGARPRPELEDQTIRALRARGKRSPARPFLRFAAGAAAVVGLGAVGLAGNRMIENGELAFPGSGFPARGRVAAQNQLKQLGEASQIVSMTDNSESMRSEDRLPAGGEDEPSRKLGDHLAEAKDRAKADNTPAPQQDSNIAVSSKPYGYIFSPVEGKVADFGDLTHQSLQSLKGHGLARSIYGEANSTNGTYYSYTNSLPTSATSTPPAPPQLETNKSAENGRPAPTYFDPEAKLKGAKAEPTSGKADGEENNRMLGGAAIKGVDPQLVEQVVKEKLKEQKLDQQAKSKFKIDSIFDSPAAPERPNAAAKGDQKPQPGGGDKKPDPNPQQPAAGPRKVVIRSGEVEFEVESFDAAVAAVTKLVGAIPEGYVSTVNSDRLANGKVRGSVVVRVPPARLDGLVLDLRKELGKGGGLKSQRIGSQDITKQYTDLESRLRAARAMEERLLQIIKTGKGEIKDLLNAEKELGVWRTRIEEYEGELRYYGNLVALSTLTVTLTEKEIRAPFEISETERVKMSIEVEDVEKAQKEALAAVTAAKGRIAKAELKQHGAGQLSAVLEFEVDPDRADEVRARLKQLGQVVVFDIDRLQQAVGGSGPAPDARRKRADTRFIVQVYNLANVQPRETVQVHLASADAEAAYKSIFDRLRRAGGRVVKSDLNRQRNDQTKGTIDGEVRTAEADAFLQAVKDLGEVITLQVVENPDAQNVTRSKRSFHVEVYALGAVPPRETAAVHLAARDVPAAYRALRDAVAKAKGRILLGQLNEQNKQNVVAVLNFEVRREEEGAVLAALAALGDIVSRNVTRAQEGQNAIESKVRLDVQIQDLANVPPRETVTLGVEVADVDRTAAAFTAYVAEAKGRVTQSQMNRLPDGQTTARLLFDVPLTAAAGLVEKFKAAGTVRSQQASRNAQVPESELALARIDVTLSNTELIVPSNQGVWPQVRKGLSTSFLAISWSLTVVIIGICFVLPWAVAIYLVYLIVRRLRRQSAAQAPPA